jgi:hypothetical protein
MQQSWLAHLHTKEAAQRWRLAGWRGYRLAAAVEDDPDVGECLEDDGVESRRVEREVRLEQALQLRRAEHLTAHDHLHHRLPEVAVRVLRPLHYRQAPPDLLLRHHQRPESGLTRARVHAARHRTPPPMPLGLGRRRVLARVVGGGVRGHEASRGEEGLCLVVGVILHLLVGGGEAVGVGRERTHGTPVNEDVLVTPAAAAVPGEGAPLLVL